MPKKISKGDRGADVERWQRILVSLGFDPNGTDGIFGNGTLQATRLFQRAHGLTPDGIVGRNTWGAANLATSEPNVLKRNSRGPDVQKWQRLLLDKGFDPNGVDGIFGAGTESATKRFQTAHGLRSDGIVSSKTWDAALGVAVVGDPAPTTNSPFLKDRIDISKIALEPATKAAGRDVGVIRTWNRFGGLITALAGELKFDPDAAAAVLAVESGGTGMTASGPTIRFENHTFFKEWGESHRSTFQAHFKYGSPRWQGHKWRRSATGNWTTCHKSQASEWEVFRFAASFDENAAIRSMSIGLAQIMGFNHRIVGYDTPKQMLDAFSASEGAQVVGFFDFVQYNKLATAIQNKDWNAFAKVYNGKGKFAVYGEKMRKAYEQLRAAK